MPNAYPFIVGLLLVGIAGCGDADERTPFDGPLASVQPMLGKADGMDMADGSCQVVLRSVERRQDGGDYEVVCHEGECDYVWRGVIDVADEVPTDARVKVLYHLDSDPTWWEQDAQRGGTGNPGFRRYTFTLDHHVFGPDGVGTIELVAFSVDADGGRTFDHNVHADPFENTLLVESNGFRAETYGVCQPEMGTITFGADWNESLSRSLRQGGYLEIKYDLERLPECRGTHNGYPAWDTLAHAMFLPGGELASGSVRELITDDGLPTNLASSTPWVALIPESATSVEIWFENTTGAGSSCHTWDSNFDHNYAFDVSPSRDDPRCLDVQKETGTHSEDPRMAHNQDYCLPYEFSANEDAAACEFHLEGFGDGYVGHYGIPFEWLVAFLRIDGVGGAVLDAGMFVRFRDKATGEIGQRFLLGIEEEEGLWRTGFAHHTASIHGDGFDADIAAFSFFVDVQRPDGEVVRLWQSRSGQNYTWNDAFGLPTTNEYIPYGNIQWANEASAVYDSPSCER